MIKKKPKVSIIMAIHSGIVDEINTEAKFVLESIKDTINIIT